MKSMPAIGCAALAVAFIGCTAIPTPDPDPNPTVNQFETVRKVLDDYLGSDPPGAIKADAVFDRLNDGDDSTTPYVLSVRAPEHYALGHVPGAPNIPWRNVSEDDALADLPTDEQIVVYCYTGHTGAVATACLNAAGYNAVNMKYGMTAWTHDPEVRVASPFSEDTGNDYPTDTAPVVPETTNDFPDLDVTTSTVEAEIVQAATQAYLGAGTAPTITASDLFDLLNDGDETNDPFVISVRGPSDYALGHISGAINIPWKTIAQLDSLRMIPPDRDIVVYCYTGHTGGLATTVLNLLGYNARNMKFGIVSWTADAEVRATSAFSEDVDAHDYPLEP